MISFDKLLSQIKLFFLKKFLHLCLQFTPSFVTQKKSDVGIVSLLCHEYLPLFLVGIKSFLFFSKVDLGLTIIDDGTLTVEDIRTLKQHFTDCVIIRSQQANKLIFHQLAQLPFSLRFRKSSFPSTFNLQKKAFDPILLSKYRKFILIDSDILFFKPPQEIISWIKSENKQTLNLSYLKDFIRRKDDAPVKWYFIPVRIISQIHKLKQIPYFNSGLICGYKNEFHLTKVEQIVKELTEFGLDNTFALEQVMFSLLFNTKQSSSEFLDPQIYATLTDERLRNNPEKICLHYAGPVKTKMYFDAIKLLLKNNFFRITPSRK